jgi:bifunctional non-homologous end joining protein LigD
MALDEYRLKRKFDRTREPAPEVPGPAGERAIFVVQLHHARRRHFDFRLQVGDTLKSWAVPKGPSYDPAVKRLAVEVEDHPVAYADFEGDIVEGNYGAGHVDTFDRGVWSTRGDAEAQLQKGHLRFELFGERLKGGWHLIRSGKQAAKPQWMLMKAKDAYAGDVEADDLLDANMAASTRRAAARQKTPPKTASPRAHRKAPPKPRKVTAARLQKLAAAATHSRKRRISAAFFKPELARLRDAPPQGDDWLHEVKWDGYRILTAVADGEVNLWSRNALPWNERLPDIRQAVAGLGLDSARLDGELIALDARGHSDFNALQKTLSGEAQAPLVYMLFDLPYLQGHDLSACPLLERKALLETLLHGTPSPLALSTHSRGDGDAAFAMAMEQQLEGIVSKRVDSPYRAGRGDDWRKAKRLDSDEFAVVGYTRGKGSRAGFGSLLLARPNGRGGWSYAGRVGTGFSDALLRELGESLATGGGRTPTVDKASIDPLLRGALWLPPAVVVEVYFRGIAGNGLLRQASLKTMREDKSPQDLLDADRPHPKRAAAAAKASPRQSKAAKPAARRAPAKSADKAGPGAAEKSSAVTITHPDRVVFPDDGVTKQDVADYYRAVMDGFLPGVVGRPLSIIRCPEGIGGTCFFQKHLLSGLKHVDSVRLKEESGSAGVYLFVSDAESVIELVQFGTLEFHPWGATATDPEHADYLVFDLDPDPGVAWSRMVAAARLLRKLLRESSLESFVRTTGGKGLHVVVPLNPPCAWDIAKRFAQGFAQALAEMHPLEFVAVASKSRRKDRIFVDYLRNARGSTSVASYSLRARAGAPVAVPLRWEDLGRVKGGNAFDIHSVPARLARLRKDPWEGFETLRQGLESAMRGKRRQTK